MSEGKNGRDYEDVKIAVGLERWIMGEIFGGWFNLWVYKINWERNER